METLNIKWNTTPSHQDTIFSLDVNLNYMVSGSQTGQMKIWNIHNRKCLHTIQTNDPRLQEGYKDSI